MSKNLEYTIFSYDEQTALSSLLPKRQSQSNKGSFGRVLCICGSYGMAGAAILSAKAAYRSGCGIVEIFTHECNRIILQTALPEAVLCVYTDESYSSDILREAVERADCIVAGCGLGITPFSRRLLSDLLHSVNTEKTPTVLDADALNLLARNPSLLRRAKGTIITPHIKEMSRLTKAEVEEILGSVPDTAYNFAQRHELICVLKCHRTAVSDGGKRLYVNISGNSGLATAGSGDVLSGIIGGILAQSKGVSLFETTCSAVYIHGLCGELASEKLTEYSTMASDLISALPILLRNDINKQTAN